MGGTGGGFAGRCPNACLADDLRWALTTCFLRAAGGGQQRGPSLRHAGWTRRRRSNANACQNRLAQLSSNNGLFGSAWQAAAPARRSMAGCCQQRSGRAQRYLRCSRARMHAKTAPQNDLPAGSCIPPRLRFVNVATVSAGPPCMSVSSAQACSLCRGFRSMAASATPAPPRPAHARLPASLPGRAAGKTTQWVVSDGLKAPVSSHRHTVPCPRSSASWATLGRPLCAGGERHRTSSNGTSHQAVWWKRAPSGLPLKPHPSHHFWVLSVRVWPRGAACTRPVPICRVLLAWRRSAEKQGETF